MARCLCAEEGDESEDSCFGLACVEAFALVSFYVFEELDGFWRCATT